MNADDSVTEDTRKTIDPKPKLRGSAGVQSNEQRRARLFRGRWAMKLENHQSARLLLSVFRRLLPSVETEIPQVFIAFPMAAASWTESKHKVYV